MKAVEFQSTVAPGGAIEIPPDVAREIPAGEPLRVLVMWEVSDHDNLWREAGRRRFEAAYSPADTVYEKLMDDTEAR